MPAITAQQEKKLNEATDRERRDIELHNELDREKEAKIIESIVRRDYKFLPENRLNFGY